MANSNSANRVAFTLLELLAATFLLVLLFAALTGLLRSFAAQERLFERLSQIRPDTKLLAEQLRRDLIGARYVQQSPGALKLVGTVARDWQSRQTTGRQAEVVYRVATVGDQTCLMRRETHLDEASTQRSREEPVWFGAANIELILLDEILGTDVGRAPPGMLPAPTRSSVVVTRSDGTVLLSASVVQSWEET